MMQATDLRDRHDSALAGRRDRTRNRRVVVQAITVSGLTMTSADRQSLHTRESQAHRIRSAGDSLGRFRAERCSTPS